MHARSHTHTRTHTHARTHTHSHRYTNIHMHLRVGGLKKKFSKSKVFKERHDNYLPWIHTSVTQIISCLIFFVFVCSNIQPLNYREQEPKTHNLQFMFLTHLRLWHKVKVLSQSLNDECLALMVSEEKPTLKFVLNQETCQLSPLKMCGKSKIVVCSWSTWHHQQSYKV